MRVPEEEKAALKYICMLHLAGLDPYRGRWIFKASFSSVLQSRKCSSFIAKVLVLYLSLPEETTLQQ